MVEDGPVEATEISWPGVRVGGVLRAGALESSVLAYGERDGRTAFLLVGAWWSPAGPHELPASLPGRVRTVAARAEAPVSVLEGERQAAVWVDGRPRILDLPLDAHDRAPARVWATAGDDDGRFVVGYPHPDGLRLELVRDAPHWRDDQFTDGAPLTIIDTPGALVVQGDPDDLRIASTSAFEVVAGPVGDPAHGAAQVWVRPYQGYGPEPWMRLDADGPPLLEVLDVVDRGSDPALLARTAEGVAFGWVMDDLSLEIDHVPGLLLDPTFPRALVADGATNIVYAVQSPSGPELRFGEADEWDVATGTEHRVSLPAGRLMAAACAPDEDGTDVGYAVVDHHLYAVPLVAPRG